MRAVDPRPSEWRSFGRSISKGRFGSDQATPVEPASAPPVEPAPKGWRCGLASRPVVGRAGSHWRA